MWSTFAKGSRGIQTLRVATLAIAACTTASIATVPTAAWAQAAPAAAKGIDDTWQGTLHAGRDLRIVLKIAKQPDGSLQSQFYSIDQNGASIVVKTTTFTGGVLHLDVPAIIGTYDGTISPDGNTIAGKWKQGENATDLVLVRATAETAWNIPAPPPKIEPMDPKADPSPEVATIKLSPPDAKGKNFGGAPRRFQTRNTTLLDLLMFAYDLNSKQILNGPAWLETDHFDLMMQPDLPGAPSEAQVRSMMRKLLADRFQLKIHQEKKEMSAYVLTVAKGGPKLTKSDADPNSPHGFFFTKLGVLHVRNATLDDFAHGMQSAVFDRPVVNKTGIEGHWDCELKWNPDETQFAVFGVPVKPSDAPDAPPPVYQAIQEQIGLKLDPTRTQVDVIVLDHVEKPSEN